MNKILVVIFIFFVFDATITQAQIIYEESNVSDLELSLNKINLIHRFYPLINGDGFTVNIKENKVDSLDIDFKGRYLKSPLSSSFISNHATDMATILVGGGNAYATKKGVAWKAAIISTSFANLLPESDDFYRINKVFVENHSYGTDIQNLYAANTVAYDASANRLAEVLHVFSVGNSGLDTPKDGKYKGITTFSNLTGSFKQAKNTLTVGAVDSLGKIENRSSRGPTFDGRIKPELVAFGQDGSSGAAALVSGIATLLQQQYAVLRAGVKPPSALVKALLINSAEDVGTKGIDYQSGYGNVNGFLALQTLNNGRYFLGEITNGATQTFPISIPSAVKNLKITLVWNDPAAKQAATTALINDLDISVVLPSGTRVLPWVLSNFPLADSLKKLPVRTRDALNNVEQISLENPTAGQYSIVIAGYKIPQGKQAYSVVYQWELADNFQWQFPLAQDIIQPNQSNLIRWNSSFSDTKGILEYSPNAGRSWVRVADVDVSKGAYRWQTPALFYTPARLRMNVANKAFMSDTFAISKPLTITVGYNCKDSLLLFWNAPEFVGRYVVYQLGNKYVEAITQTSRSSIVIKKSQFNGEYFAVAPVLDNGKLGVRSNAINVNTQGVECFLKSFLVDISQKNTAKLSVSLSTLQNVKYLVFQQYDGKDFQDLYGFIPKPNTFNYSYDQLLKQGESSFRIKVIFQNNVAGYSNIETVFYFDDTHQFIHYPNPIRMGDNLTIRVQNPIGSLWQLFNSSGQLLMQKTLDSEIVNEAFNFPTGTYFYRISQNNALVDSGKLVVE